MPDEFRLYADDALLRLLSADHVQKKFRRGLRLLHDVVFETVTDTSVKGQDGDLPVRQIDEMGIPGAACQLQILYFPVPLAYMSHLR